MTVAHLCHLHFENTTWYWSGNICIFAQCSFLFHFKIHVYLFFQPTHYARLSVLSMDKM